jgi:hypothetical protein
MIVRGRLITEGTPEKFVNLTGDRTGDVITGITFDLMSKQWAGLQFTPSSTGNTLSHTCIRNTVYGVIVSGDGTNDDNAKLSLLNCKLRNSGDLALESHNANVTAIGCEFAEASNGLVWLDGGKYVFNHCTLANYYLFTSIGGAGLQISKLYNDSLGEGDVITSAEIANCILYGLGTDINPGMLDNSSVFLRNCLLKSEGTNDDNFINCLWGSDPLYYTVREQYLFDYRVKDNSPAIRAANAQLTLPEAAKDIYGLARGSNPDLGAYVYVAQQ